MRLCGFEAGLDKPLFLIAGPCVVESEQLQMDVAGQLKEMTGALGIPFIFKSSYDKANRSSGKSFRGPGMEKGLEILAKVRKSIGVQFHPEFTSTPREGHPLFKSFIKAALEQHKLRVPEPALKVIGGSAA